MAQQLNNAQAEQIDDIEEPSSQALADAGSGDTDSEVGLACASATNQHEVALMIQEVTTDQVPDQGLIDGCVFKAELLQFLGQGQLGDGHLIFDGPRLLLANLGTEKITDNLLWFVLTFDGSGEDLVISRLHPVELEGAHRIEYG